MDSDNSHKVKLMSSDKVPNKPVNAKPVGYDGSPGPAIIGIMIPHYVMARVDLTPATKLVYGRIASFAATNKKLYFSHEWLCNQLGLGIATVRRSLKALADGGLILIEPRDGTTNYYSILYPDQNDQPPSSKRSGGGANLITPPDQNDHQDIEKEIEGGIESRDAPAKPSPQGQYIPADWQPDNKLREWFYETSGGSDLDLETEVADFVDYWQGESGQRARKRDWAAAFRTWVRRSARGVSKRNQRTFGQLRSDRNSNTLRDFLDSEEAGRDEDSGVVAFPARRRPS